MKRYLSILLLLTGTQLFSQARILINNNAYIVMNNPVYLVIDNPNANAITTLGTGGNIISENENNIIKWNIATSTGNYIIPFTTNSGIKIPLAFNITSAATGAGNIQFSTYNGTTWNNDLYKPAGVTNMTNMGVPNNSSEVIDRFWLLDAQGYATKPSGNIDFSYADAEHTAPGNTITESELKAERYDNTANSWDLYLSGVCNPVSNIVSGVPFSAADFFRSFSLIDQTAHPLPITLVSFTAECNVSNAVITWQTASEINADYFILEASDDGINFTPVAYIDAAGNSATEHTYSYTVENNSVTYYRLMLINLDGSAGELGVNTVSCEADGFIVNAFYSGRQQITMQTQNLPEGNYLLQIFDIAGKIFLRKNVLIQNNFEEFILHDNTLAEGIYILNLRNTSAQPFNYSKKIQVLY